MWIIRLQSIHSCCQIISYHFRGLGKRSQKMVILGKMNHFQWDESLRDYDRKQSTVIQVLCAHRNTSAGFSCTSISFLTVLKLPALYHFTWVLYLFLNLASASNQLGSGLNFQTLKQLQWAPLTKFSRWFWIVRFSSKSPKGSVACMIGTGLVRM